MTELSMQEMEDVVTDRVLDLMDKFETALGHNCLYECNAPDEILFNRKGRTAGTSMFYYGKGSGYLNFNPILMKENWEEFDQIVVHEVAHYCVSLYHGKLMTRSGRKRISHGDCWKNMMRFFDKTPDRCHSYDCTTAQTRTQRRWEYKCSCQTHMVSTTMHNKIRRGSARDCKRCGVTVKYTGV